MDDLTAPERGSQPLKEWLDCATSFCELLKTLDREGVNGAAWMGQELPDGLNSAGETYLRAAGAATERFSRVAEEFVRGMEPTMYLGLMFSVEAGEPIRECELATLRIQSLRNTGRKQATRAHFVPIGLEQRYSESLLFGAEARVALLTHPSDVRETSGPYQLIPAVRLTYEVTGQQALKVFASVLQDSAIQSIWRAVGGFDVETSIQLSKEDSLDSIEEEWTTNDDPDGQRLLKFCLKASRLSDQDTPDWPPYLRLTCMLDSSNTQRDFGRYFAAICAHTTCIVGPSGGWTELLGDAETKGLISRT